MGTKIKARQTKPLLNIVLEAISIDKNNNNCSVACSYLENSLNYNYCSFLEQELFHNRDSILRCEKCMSFFKEDDEDDMLQEKTMDKNIEKFRGEK